MFQANNRVQKQNSKNRARQRRTSNSNVSPQVSTEMVGYGDPEISPGSPSSPGSGSWSDGVPRQNTDDITDYTKATKRNNGKYSLADRMREEENEKLHRGSMAHVQNMASSSSDREEGLVGSPKPSKGSPKESSPRPVSSPDASSTEEGPAIEGRLSNAAKNWEKIRLANKMAQGENEKARQQQQQQQQQQADAAVASTHLAYPTYAFASLAAGFKAVHEDIQKLGATADDEHIDWTEVYKGDDNAQRLQEKKYIVDPHGTFRITWDIFMSLILLYIAFYVPYRVCLYWDDENTSQGMQVVEYISDGLFGIDIILNFFTAYHDPSSGVLVTSHRKIALHYIKTYFIIDLMASFPFGLVLDGSAKTLNKSGKVMRLPRLIKFLRLMRLLKLLRVVRLRQFVSRVETDFSIHHGISRMLKIIFTVLLVTHLVGCLWYMIGRTGGEGDINGGWQWR